MVIPWALLVAQQWYQSRGSTKSSRVILTKGFGLNFGVQLTYMVVLGPMWMIDFPHDPTGRNVSKRFKLITIYYLSHSILYHLYNMYTF